MDVIVLVILLDELDVQPFFLMIMSICYAYHISGILVFGQFSTIKGSCGSPYPTLLLISFKNLLILQLLDNEFHEVVF